MTKNLPERLEEIFKSDSITHLILDSLFKDKKLTREFIGQAKNEIKKIYDNQIIKNEISNSVQSQIENLSDEVISAGFQAMKNWMSGKNEKIAENQLKQFLGLLRENSKNSKEFPRVSQELDKLLQDKKVHKMFGEDAENLRDELKKVDQPEESAKKRAEYTQIIVRYCQNLL